MVGAGRGAALAYDGMHLTPPGNAIIADALAPEVLAAAASEPAAGK